ncbi:MAG TPA: C25 family cysteine peptidase, partial [Candidatus Thermoplasmatota archaeon]|nr:C25 family cysteine peptidase [Candidatus Thermoplasmatota archaeon]
MDQVQTKIMAVILVITFIISAAALSYVMSISSVDDGKKEIEKDSKFPIIEKQFTFSEPEIIEGTEYLNIYVEESDFNSIHDQWPVLPVNVTTFEFAFGTKILDVETILSESKKISLSKEVAYGSCSTLTGESEDIYDSEDVYPSNVVSYHTGGGLSNGEHKTFLTLRIYPVTYSPKLNQAHFVDNVSVKITYKEPSEPLLDDVDEYELLIISPDDFVNNLERLVTHKNHQGIRTRVKTVEEIKEDRLGCDLQEGIKYFIKQEIEESGIDYVLLVGGRDRQS